jgi:hypothetical protein
MQTTALLGSALVVVATLLPGCDAGRPTTIALQDPEQNGVVPELSSRSALPAVERLVAIGDLHGDVNAARKALRTAGAIGASDTWIGGKLVVVQTGDQIDRGEDDRQVLDLFDKLKGEAARAGGEVISLSGNHEIMNATFDFRYVSAEGFAAFDGITPVGREARQAASFKPAERGRASAFAPGGVYASLLAERPVVIRVGDSMFVHGGIKMKHATYGIDRINDGVHDWLAGGAAAPPDIVVADDGPIWMRDYSEPASLGQETCDKLGALLVKLHAVRLVMGHTVQEAGITSACDGKAWRIDVGMSHVYGGPIQVLEVRAGAARVLRGP